MNDELLMMIAKMFKEEEQEVIREAMNSITLDLVMDSEINLFNTQRSIIQLSKGSLEDFQNYVKCAKKDFRDVIYWASN